MNAYKGPLLKSVYKIAVALGFLLLQQDLSAQQTTVLPGNGNYGRTSGPQGGLRYQRGFYLLKPSEMQHTGLANGMPITAIGFTIGAAQKDTTRGAFKVYLQNTTDTVSRVDTSWTDVPSILTNSYTIPSGLFPGSYEWQVRAVCGSNSIYSLSSQFANDQLAACRPPTNLSTTNIASTSATFNWEAPAVTVTKYYVEYKNQDSTNWIQDSTVSTSYNASGLIAGKTYQWRVRTSCSSSASDFTSVSFATEAADSCNEPTGLTVGTVDDTSGQVSWTAAASANYYNIRYRRSGTSNWLNTTSFTTSFKITAGIVLGTTYEWQVRSACAGGTGAFVAGSNFTTTGTAVCYPPENTTANSITDSSVVFKWNTVLGATSYQLRYRLKNTISWVNAITPTPNMTLVHNDSLDVPNTTGPYDIPFVNGSNFTYTGGGVYVAWEYSQSTAPLTTPNTTVSTNANTSIPDINGIDSVRFLLSFIGRSDTMVTGLQSRLSSTDLRPETRFGSSSLKDSVAVVSVYALGSYAKNFTSAPISALIQNNTNSSKTYNVTLTVKDAKTNASRYSNMQSFSVAADTAEVVTFSGWIPTIMEKDSIIISIPAGPDENVLNNNVNHYIQQVVGDVVSYADSSNAAGQAGYDTLSGLILSRHYMEGCGKVNSVQVYLSSSAAGHSVYAVAVDTAETIIGQSASFTPDSSQVNKYHTFYITNSSLLRNVHYYVGLAQEATTPGNGYFPVGMQWEAGRVRDSAYFSAKLNGDSIRNQPLFGRLMIKAGLISAVPSPAITGGLVLCPSASSLTLTASTISRRYADSVIAFSSQNSPNEYSANRVIGAPDVYPNYGISTNAWASTSADGSREYLTLRFPNAAPVNVVEIYETFYPGAVDSVFVKNPGTNNFDLVYSATAKAAPQTARRNRISFPMTAYNVSEVRIAIASDSVVGYNCIDAVAIGQLTTPGTFSTYLWSPGGETIATKTVTTAGGYKVTVSDGLGCLATDSVTVITPVQTAPVITAIGPTTFCNGDSVKLRSSKVGGNTWSTGATTDSIFVKVGGSYTVTHDDGSGCGTTTSAAVTVTVNSLPVVSISGTLGICPGASTTLTASPSGGGNTYAWSNGGTASTNIIFSPGVISVQVTNSNGCKASAQATTFYVSAPAPNITGTFAFCPGGTGTLNAGSGYASYSWSTGETGVSSITVNTPGTYSVTVTNAFGCSGSDNQVVTQNTPPAPFIAGGLSLCSGPTNLNAGGGYSSYLWSTSETTQEITVNAAGNYSVTVTDAIGCSGSTSVTISTDSLPATPGPISGDVNGVCNSAGATFTISPVLNTTHYVWFVPPGTTIVSGQGTTSLVLAFDPGFISGDLIVAASNTCGQSGSLNPRVLPLNAEPADPTTINGNLSGLCGLIGQVYSTPVIPSATSYTWTVSPGITITGGAGTNSITVSFSGSFTNGTICVKANNACGSSDNKCINVSGIPANLGAISGPTAACFGQANVIYSVPAVAGAISYIWTVPQQAVITLGQGTNIIKVSFGNKSGNVTVRAVNACGTTPQQLLAVVVTNCIGRSGVSPVEQRFQPEVIANDGGLSKTDQMQVAWTLGEPLIESIVKNNNLYTQGFHQPIVLKKGNAIVINDNDDISITAAPNPVQYTLTVSYKSKKAENLVISLLDVNGKVVFVKPINGVTGTMKIDMSVFSNGMYFVNIRRVEGSLNRNIKVVKAD